MTYRQSGIIYRQPNFAYNKSDATVSVATIAVPTNLVLTASYTYRPTERPGFVDYRNGNGYNNAGWEYNERDNTAPDDQLLRIYNQPNVSYRQASDVGISFKVVAFPGSIPIPTTVGGTGSIPVTIVASSIAVTSQVAAATGPLAIDLNMNYIALPGHIITVTAAPSATPIHIQSPATIGVTTDKIDDSNLFIATVVYSPLIVVPSDIKASTTPMSVVLTPQTINVKADVQVIPIYRQVVQWTENIVQRTSPEGTITANSLQRYMGPLPRARNIFIINNATVSDTQPYDHSTVTRTILGAHATPLDLTEAEETLLVAAGYPFNVGPPDASL
tara:strand:- start:1838 stop:2830 length:993 start_codon:yes stop_codon:yes gene_type:complete